MNMSNPDLVEEILKRRKIQDLRNALEYKYNTKGHIAKATAWNIANPERKAANYKAWVEENPEKRATSSKSFEKTNRTKRNTQSRVIKDTYSIKRRHSINLKNNYGPQAPEHQAKQLEEQDGCCPICLDSLKSGHQDHDHETGQLRGTLCPRCNTSLERVDKYPGWGQRAEAYVGKWKSQPEQDRIYIPKV